MGSFSDSPAEGRRSSFAVDVFDFLFLLISLNWIDFSFLMFKKATQCRLLKPLVRFKPYSVTKHNRPFATSGHVLGYHIATPYWRASIPVISKNIQVTAICVRTKSREE